MVIEQEVSCFSHDQLFSEEESLKCEQYDLEEANDVDDCSFPTSDFFFRKHRASDRPVTPIIHTLTKPCPQAVPVAINEPDELSQWKDRVKNTRVHRDERIFNNRTHWNMRCKFLEVGLRMSGLNTIRENPDQSYEKPEGGFYICIPVKRNKDLGGKESKLASIVRKTNDSEATNCSKEPTTKITTKENVGGSFGVINKSEKSEMKSESVDNLHQATHETLDPKSHRINDQLVLEDVTDKDIVPESVLPSSRRIILGKNDNVTENSSNDSVNRVRSEKGRSEANIRVSLSRLERFRERLAQFFGRLGKNRVTPV